MSGPLDEAIVEQLRRCNPVAVKLPPLLMFALVTQIGIADIMPGNAVNTATSLGDLTDDLRRRLTPPLLELADDTALSAKAWLERPVRLRLMEAAIAIGGNPN